MLEKSIRPTVYLLVKKADLLLAYLCPEELIRPVYLWLIVIRPTCKAPASHPQPPL